MVKHIVAELRRYEVIDQSMNVMLVGLSPTSLVPARSGAVLSPAIAAVVGDIVLHHDFTIGPKITVVGRRLRVSIFRLDDRDGIPYFGIATERILSVGHVDDSARRQRLSRSKAM